MGRLPPERAYLPALPARGVKPAIAGLLLLTLAIIAADSQVWADDPPAPSLAASDLPVQASRLLPPSPSELAAIKFTSGLSDPAVAAVVDKLGQISQPSALKIRKARAKISLSPRQGKTPSSLLIQSWKALRTGDGLAALRAVDRALSESPDNPDALNLKAYILAHMDRHDDAIETLCFLLERDPQNAEALRNLAIELGRSSAPQALKELEDMAAADPSSAPVQAALARQYAKRQDQTRALAALDRAARRAPQNLAYRVELASLYDRYGYPSEAETLYRQASEAAQSRREAGKSQTGDESEEPDDPAMTPELLRAVRARADYLARNALRARESASNAPRSATSLPDE